MKIDLRTKRQKDLHIMLMYIICVPYKYNIKFNIRFI